MTKNSAKNYNIKMNNLIKIQKNKSFTFFGLFCHKLNVIPLNNMESENFFSLLASRISHLIPRFSFLRSPFPAFTLAEVLVTLGIIGIIAAMTIPVLIKNNDKLSTVTSLQKFYSTMSQAIKLSEGVNGPVSTWTYPTTNNDGNQIETWFNTYLSPYIKYSTTDKQSTALTVYLNNGSRFNLQYIGYVHFFFYTNTNRPTVGKNAFTFLIYNSQFQPYTYPYTLSDITRTTLLTDATYGCSTANNNRAYCTALIQRDGWKIESDYPYFN